MTNEQKEEEDNKYKKKLYYKKYNEKNIEKIRAYGRKYYSQNPQKFRDRAKKYYENNKDKFKEYKKKYNKIKINCEQCDKIISKKHKIRHMKTKKCVKIYKQKLLLLNRCIIKIEA